MRKFVLVLLLFSNLAFGEADWLSPAGMTQVMNGVDDSTYHVSLGHAFPYMGGVFTDAWMSSNGFLLLYDPINNYGNPNTWNNGCCSGYNPLGNNGFSFMLAPLWTDLNDSNRTADDGYYYKTNESISSFLWYNIDECCSSGNTNTFQVNLFPDGSFDFLYDEVDVVYHSVWAGFTGFTNIQTDIHQLYYGQNNTTEFSINNQTNMQLFSGQGYAWYGQDGGYDTTLDCSNPLNNTACAGYQQAYLDQQCLFNSLYSQQCPGYAQAYYDQQCSQNALYDSGCAGYAGAYFAQQCELDVFYSSQCPGYRQAVLLQETSGMNFVYGDDISDFLATEQEEDYGYTEEPVYEDTTGYEELTEEFVDDGGDIYVEELATIPDEPFIEPEEIISDDSIIELEEDFLSADEPVEQVNALEIAMAEMDKAEEVALAQEVTLEPSISDSSFEAIDAAFEVATFEAIIMEAQQEASVEVKMESATPTQDSGFAAQQDQSFSTGQSISAVLNNVAPNYSKFDVAPPSQAEQRQTAKAEAAAESMSEEDLASSMEGMMDNMKESGGFGDQSLTMFLLGRNAGFAQYNGQLQDNPFYNDKGLPVSRVQNDRNTMAQLIGTDDKHQRLVDLQYGE